ncbi:TetR/AcrR family transcriptional regulator [Endozoicomonas sp. G2_2]|uniref:TetR/AcrR family transcriptional regulator n=1 Tax=Gammaproteobacteria TaxID=1236 RepID=UPI001AD97B33|nr:MULTISPECIES: TetR/AcrR family transcriptional regulator [Gammaproteobacteria]MBO9471302.1 TetR/AcrR family transcriptional regulator [Endozoicomonas sp. G2_2]
MARRPVSETGDTHAHLRRVSFRLFGQFGYDGVSLLTIAQAAGLTKSAMYGHFAGKQALYADCMTQLVALFEAHVLDTAGTADDALERVILLFRGLQNLSTDERVADGIGGYWLRPNTADVTDAREVLKHFETRARDVVEAYVVEAQAAGRLKQNAPPKEIARAFIAIMEAIVLPLGERATSDQSELVSVLAKIFFEAYATDTTTIERARAVLG